MSTAFTHQLHHVLATTPRTEEEAARLLKWNRRRVSRALQHLVHQGLIECVGRSDGKHLFGIPARRSSK